MSARASPESATAPVTASSACAARGTSAERVTFEKPTPLTAILQRFSHMPLLRYVYSASRRLAASSAPGASSSSTMMLAYGTADAKRLSPV